jgi:hypothetical protein
MGIFGGPYVDSRDSVTFLSCLMLLSDLPNEDGWEPGRLHLLGVRCYATLEYLYVNYSKWDHATNLHIQLADLFHWAATSRWNVSSCA